MRVVSVNIGRESTLEIRGKTQKTGLYKTPRLGPQRLDLRGLEGDAVVEARRGGQTEQALSVYPSEHYEAFGDAFSGAEHGAFGENLTTHGLLESEVRVGDIFRIGSSLVQISHPRLPCKKLEYRHGRGFSRRFLRSRRVGFYLRVLEPGEIAAGDTIEVVSRDADSPTLDEFLRVTQEDYWDTEALARALGARDLSEPWRAVIADKLERSRSEEGWYGSRSLVISDIAPEAGDVVSIHLRCALGRDLPRYRPGQLLVLSLPLSEAGTSLGQRAYALTGDPEGGSTYQIVTRRRRTPSSTSGGMVSSYLPADVEVGQRIRALAPRGGFVLPEPEECGTLVFVTEGLGAAPVVSMLGELRARATPTVSYLIHTDTDPSQHAFRKETEALAVELGTVTRFFYRAPVSEAGVPGRVAVGWPGVEELWNLASGPGPTHVLIAGSESYVIYVTAGLERLGLEPSFRRCLDFGVGERET